MSKNEQPAQGSLESASLTLWCENLSALHVPQMIANVHHLTDGSESVAGSPSV